MTLTTTSKPTSGIGSESCNTMSLGGGRVIRSLASLPNSAGYPFVGLLRNGQIVRCRVVLDDDKCHKVEGAKFSELQGWMEASQPFSGRAH